MQTATLCFFLFEMISRKGPSKSRLRRKSIFFLSQFHTFPNVEQPSFTILCIFSGFFISVYFSAYSVIASYCFTYRKFKGCLCDYSPRTKQFCQTLQQSFTNLLADSIDFPFEHRTARKSFIPFGVRKLDMNPQN